jgi:hypothetical protein
MTDAPDYGPLSDEEIEALRRELALPGAMVSFDPRVFALLATLDRDRALAHGIMMRWPNRAAADGAIALLRVAFRDDGAEGESVHLVCKELERQREYAAYEGMLRERVAADLERAVKRAEKAEADLAREREALDLRDALLTARSDELKDTAERLQAYVDTGQTPEMVTKLVARVKLLESVSKLWNDIVGNVTDLPIQRIALDRLAKP